MTTHSHNTLNSLVKNEVNNYSNLVIYLSTIRSWFSYQEHSFLLILPIMLARLGDNDGVAGRKRNGRRSRLLIQNDVKKDINSTKLQNSTIAPTSQPSTIRQSHEHVTSSIIWSSKEESEEFNTYKENGSHLSLIGWSIIFPLALFGLWVLQKKQRVNTVGDQTRNNHNAIMEKDGCGTLSVCGKVEDVVLESTCIEVASNKTSGCNMIFPKKGACQWDNLDQTSCTFGDYVSFNFQDSQK